MDVGVDHVADKIGQARDQAIAEAGVLQPGGVGLQQVVQHQVVHREKHGHGQNGQGQHQIIRGGVRAAAAQQKQGKSQGDDGGGQQVDGRQGFQPGGENAQDDPGLPVKPVGQHTAVAVEEQDLGHGIAPVDEVHQKQHHRQRRNQCAVDGGGYFRQCQTGGAAQGQRGPGDNGGAPGRTHQKPVIAAHKQLVEPGTAGFPAVRACVQGQLALILGLGLPGCRLGTVAAEQGYVRREQVPVHPAIAGKTQQICGAPRAASRRQPADGIHGGGGQGPVQQERGQIRRRQQKNGGTLQQGEPLFVPGQDAPPVEVPQLQSRREELDAAHQHRGQQTQGQPLPQDQMPHQQRRRQEAHGGFQQIVPIR